MLSRLPKFLGGNGGRRKSAQEEVPSMQELVARSQYMPQSSDEVLADLRGRLAKVTNLSALAAVVNSRNELSKLVLVGVDLTDFDLLLDSAKEKVLVSKIDVCLGAQKLFYEKLSECTTKEAVDELEASTIARFSNILSGKDNVEIDVEHETITFDGLCMSANDDKEVGSSFIILFVKIKVDSKKRRLEIEELNGDNRKK